MFKMYFIAEIFISWVKFDKQTIVSKKKKLQKLEGVLKLYKRNFINKICFELIF